LNTWEKYRHVSGLTMIKQFVEFNRQLLIQCDEDMQREHYKKNVFINILFEEDKKAMRDIPKAEYEIYRIEKLKSDKYGKLNFDNRKYSSGPQYAQREINDKSRCLLGCNYG